MNQTGGVTYIGVSLKDLNKYFKDEAVIHVSKKFLKSYEMISGITETPKPISMNVIDKSEKIAEPVVESIQKIEKIDTEVEPEREAAPPVELYVSKGDW